jgi:hypothetical protein
MASAYLTCLATGAAAHWPRPEEVIDKIESRAMRETFGVVDVTRDPRLPRLLVVRVGERWRVAEPSARRAAAEEWWSSWRHTIPQGILAVLEQGTDRPLVNFNPDGRAVVKDVPTVRGGGKDP